MDYLDSKWKDTDAETTATSLEVDCELTEEGVTQYRTKSGRPCVSWHWALRFGEAPQLLSGSPAWPFRDDADFLTAERLP